VAIRSKVTVREGGEADIPTFFELMSATCVRQHVQPNPPSVEALRHLIRVFDSGDAIRLSFAEYNGATIACELALKFGDRLTCWKKGWNGDHPKLHANALLHHELLGWAYRHGFKCVDFAGMDRSLAERLLADKQLSPEEMNVRDYFNLSLGGQPRLLPPAVIYINNPMIRLLYARVLRWPRLAAKLTSVVRKLKAL
jgi:hypothetical protein